MNSCSVFIERRYPSTQSIQQNLFAFVKSEGNIPNFLLIKLDKFVVTMIFTKELV